MMPSSKRDTRRSARSRRQSPQAFRFRIHGTREITPVASMTFSLKSRAGRCWSSHRSAPEREESVWCYDADEVRRSVPEDRGTSMARASSRISFLPLPTRRSTRWTCWSMPISADSPEWYTARRACTHPTAGSSVLNFSADRPDILDHAHNMLVHMKWVGFCDFDFVDDPRDDVPKLMEINPRFPESFRMGLSVGIDFPMHDVRPRTRRSGRTDRRLSQEPVPSVPAR